MLRTLILTLLFGASAASAAPDAEPSARAVLERAVETVGGEAWLRPRTLVLEGTAEFHAPDQPGPRRTRRTGCRRSEAARCPLGCW